MEADACLAHIKTRRPATKPIIISSSSSSAGGVRGAELFLSNINTTKLAGWRDVNESIVRSPGRRQFDPNNH